MRRRGRGGGINRPFDQLLRALPEEEAARVSEFFGEARRHVLLPIRERDRIMGDFEAALLFLAGRGVPTGEALERLAVKRLGGFYARPPSFWFPLDDAAKVYPLSMKRGQMAVFRLSVYLREPVVPEILQMALTFTVPRFPSFATTTKKGFFWHYLDTAKRRFALEPENGRPCMPLRIARSCSQSFRVLYYENRFSVEFFHILTDGTGGITFLKTLTAEYFRLLGVPCDCTDGVLALEECPHREETANEFLRAPESGARAGFVDKPAVQMSGRLTADKPYRVLHFNMNAAALRDAAKARDATVTAYVLAQLFLAGRYATDETRGEMSIQVPVNMRKYYPSRTVRNFSLYCGIRLPADAAGPAEALLPEITRQLAEKTSREAMERMMRATRGMVNALRFVPLFVKAPAARVVYGFLGDRIFTNTLSNLGVVTLPAALAPHVEHLDFVLGTAITNRVSCALVTFGNTATLTVTKMTDDPSFEERLEELLERDGVPADVEGSAIS